MVMMLRAAAERAPKEVPPQGVHPSAVIAEGVEIPGSASIGPGVVIGAGAQIGEGAIIGAHGVIESGVRVGARTRLHPRVTLLVGTKMGDECVVFPGAVVGSDGFGFLPGPNGPTKVPHLGGVTIGDRVEIGANTTIDRGKFADTMIGDATKIDNQVQIAHACQIGKGVLICGCTAIGGSVTIGDGAVLAGHVSVRDNVTIAPGAMVGGNSAIDGDVDASEPYLGYPARPISIGSRNLAAMGRLGELARTVRQLKKRLAELDAGVGAEPETTAE
jgi:UDP-3-O-[3-hydroxymyristoyl] glucosamine N-acyltransferase